MGSLNDQSIVDDFAKQAKEVYVNWQRNPPTVNQGAIKQILRWAVRNTLVPEFNYVFRNFTNGSGGQLDSNSWTLEINRVYTDRHDLPAYLFKWLCGILYHEARHGEQYFCCAQAVHEGDVQFTTPLPANPKSSEISAKFVNIPPNIVERARNVSSYRLKSAPEKKIIKKWFKSIWGAQAGHRAAVYAMPDLFAVGSAGNVAYTSLPEEVDAYAVQAQIEAAVDLQIQGAVQIAIAPKQDPATLKLQIASEMARSAPAPATRIAPTRAVVIGRSAAAVPATTATTVPAVGPTLPPASAVQSTIRTGTVASLAALFGR